MARHNIYERRAYIRHLLDTGQEIDIKSLIKMWDSSYPLILTDIAVCRGRKGRYANKPQWRTQNIRAGSLGATGELSAEDWTEVLNDSNHMCTTCGSKEDLVIDHMIPLSRGGTNTRDNIQPLCRGCNSSKSNQTPQEWAAKLAAIREDAKKGGRPRKNE